MNNYTVDEYNELFASVKSGEIDDSSDTHRRLPLRPNVTVDYQDD